MGIKSSKQRSVKTKLIGIYVGLLIIPLILVGYYLSISIRTTQIDTKIEEIEQDAVRTSDELSNILNTIVRVSDWIFQDTRLMNILETNYTSIFQLYITYQNYSQFEDYMRHHPEIQHIRIYTDNPTILNGNSINLLNAEIIETEWYQTTLEKRGQISWFYNQDPITKRPYLNLTRAIFNQDNEITAVMSIALKDEVINRIIGNSLNTSLLLLNDQLIFSQPFVEEDSDIYLDYKQFIHQSDEESMSVNGNESVSQGVSQEITFIEHQIGIEKTMHDVLKSVVTVPTAEINQDANRVLFNTFAVMIFFLTIMLSFLLVFIWQFEKRILQLQESMTKVANGDFNIPKEISGNDELTDVYQQLYTTMESLQQLMADKYNYELNQKTWEIEMQEAEFKLLASQINPHFLYNTLEMTRMKALLNKDYEVVEIIMILSRLMRNSLERQRDEVLISEDLKFIEMYLRIQKLRFEDRIQYQIIDETTQNYAILPLLIQPLIENAFVHGMEHVARPVSIEIRIKEKGDHISIEVSDNGAGMTEEKLKEIRALIASDTKSNWIGLNNIQQRIMIYYGPQYKLNIDSSVRLGTVISFEIPKRTLSETEGDINNVQSANRR